MCKLVQNLQETKSPGCNACVLVQSEISDMIVFRSTERATEYGETCGTNSKRLTAHRSNCMPDDSGGGVNSGGVSNDSGGGVKRLGRGWQTTREGVSNDSGRGVKRLGRGCQTTRAGVSNDSGGGVKRLGRVCQTTRGCQKP
jgi:hypothetical protein